MATDPTRRQQGGSSLERARSHSGKLISNLGILMECEICTGSRLEQIGTRSEWVARVSVVGDDRSTLDRLSTELGWDRDFLFLRCSDCGFIFVEPMPENAFLAQIYAQYRATKVYAPKKEKKIKRAEHRIKRFKPLIDGRRFLDVGCNLGFACVAARQLGFEATGIDLDPETISLAAEQFPDCTFASTNIIEFVETGVMPFDLVYCSEVMEHLNRVRPFVAAMAAVTKPGGIIFVTTPDAGHFRRPRDFLAWSEVRPPFHICWFTKRALGQIFEDNGFRIETFAFNPKPGIKLLARRT